MLYYQPSQRLTWKYTAGTGQLTVVSTITVDLYTNEYLNDAVVKVGNKILITLSVGTTGDPSPITVEEDVDILTTNLSKEQVRDRIRAGGISYTITGTVYKNGRPDGEVINTTSSNSEIEMGI